MEVVQDARFLELGVRCRSKMLKVERIELGVATGWQTEKSFVMHKSVKQRLYSEWLHPTIVFIYVDLHLPGQYPR